MNQQEILKKIGGIIAELKDQYSYLNAAENGFNDLELELFMANAHFLTDHIAILQKINHQSVTASLPVAKPVLQLAETPEPQIADYFDEQDLLAVEEPVQFQNKAVELIEPTLEEVVPPQATIILPEVMPQEEVVTPQEIIVLPGAMSQTESAESVKTNASFIDPKLISEPDLQKESFELKDPTSEHHSVRPETVSLNIQSESSSDFSISSNSETKSTAEPAILTLNDRIAAQKSLNQPKTETANKTAQDLQTMISLNDKLLFVKELFNGYNLAYSEAINILNRYNNFAQAENFLNQNYAAKNSWKDKPVTAEKFMDLLRKRFA
ncbi:MAG: hypothetical protein ACRYGB_08480 [Janthinobacterium lividum]